MIEPVALRRSDSGYPAALAATFGDDAPATIAALGNVDLLKPSLLALFCSLKCPGSLILRAVDAVEAIRDASVAVVGGFHSPVEKECLTLLLRGTQPVVVCPARTLDRMRIRPEYRTPLQEGRMLLVSPFAGRQRRSTSDLAIERNHFVAAMAGAILVVHAEPGGRIEQVCREAIKWGKPLYALDGLENESLFDMGARALDLSVLIRRRQIEKRS